MSLLQSGLFNYYFVNDDDDLGAAPSILVDADPKRGPEIPGLQLFFFACLHRHSGLNADFADIFLSAYDPDRLTLYQLTASDTQS